MSKFPEILILVRLKIFSAFYPILHENFFQQLWFFTYISEFNTFSPHPVLHYRKHFYSNLNNHPHSKSSKVLLLSSDLKDVLTKHFPKMQPFVHVLQNRSSYQFPDIYKKISVLESLFNKVTDLIACSFIKKGAPTQVFSCDYHKMFEGCFFKGTPLVAASENGLRISKNF